MVSEKPWSDYKESDYSTDQWHKACLIHQHDGPPTSKAQCKLPVKTPDGTLNRNGVHAAAAALAGARGGVGASDDEKAAAGKALVRYYRELGEDAPASLLEHSALPDVLEHHGVKGQKWGVRRGDTAGGFGLSGRAQKKLAKSQPSDVSVTQKKPGTRVSATGGKNQPAHEDAKRVAAIKQKAKASSTDALSNSELQQLTQRMNLEQNYSRLQGQENQARSSAGRKFVGKLLGNVAQQQATQVVNSYASELGENLKKK